MSTSSEIKVDADSTNNVISGSENVSEPIADSSTDAEMENSSHISPINDVPEVSTTSPSQNSDAPDSNFETEKAENIAGSQFGDSEVTSSDNKLVLVSEETEKKTQDCKVDSSTDADVEAEAETFVDCDSTYDENLRSLDDHEVSVADVAANTTVEVSNSTVISEFVLRSEELGDDKEAGAATVGELKSETTDETIKGRTSPSSTYDDPVLNEHSDIDNLTIEDTEAVGASEFSVENEESASDVKLQSDPECSMPTVEDRDEHDLANKCIKDHSGNDTSSVDDSSAKEPTDKLKDVEHFKEEPDSIDDSGHDQNCAAVTDVDDVNVQGKPCAIDTGPAGEVADSVALEDRECESGSEDAEEFHQAGEQLDEGVSLERDSRDEKDNYTDEDYHDLDDQDFTDEDYVIEKEYMDGDDEHEEGEILEGEDGGEEEDVLDEDQDRRNPQYIPKKGEFYEHDDRLTEEQEEKPKDSEKTVTMNKKLWKASVDKWGHDMYIETEQAPKRHQDLFNVYGYDIREESDPPRARRRRRYGRGPNKYTRNWEDQDAYIPRGRGGFRGRGGRRGGRGSFTRPIQDEDVQRSSESGTDEKTVLDETNTFGNSNFKEEFPSLNESTRPPRVMNGRGRASNRRPVLKRGNFRNLNPDRREGPSIQKEADRTSDHFAERPIRKQYSKEPVSRRLPPRGGLNSAPRTFIRSGDKSASEQQNVSRQLSSERKYLPQERPDVTQPAPALEQQQRRRFNPRVSSRVPPPTTKEAPPKASETVNEPKPPRSTQKNIPPRMASQKSSPQLDGSLNHPKRYSSLRQRNMAENPNYSSEQQPNQIMPQYYDSANIPPNIQNTNASGPQMYNAPPPIPTPYIAPAPNSMNYGPPPAAASYGGTVPAPFAPPPPAPYQPTQTYPASATTVSTVPVCQPQEVLYGGMAFYNTHTQSVGRSAPSKRPKAAIPIMPPPDRQRHNGESRDSNKLNLHVTSDEFVEENTVTYA